MLLKEDFLDNHVFFAGTGRLQLGDGLLVIQLLKCLDDDWADFQKLYRLVSISLLCLEVVLLNDQVVDYGREERT